MEPFVRFQANSFTVHCPEGWQDRTVYTLSGPVSDGIQHNVLITVEHDAPYNSVREYAEWQIAALQAELKACHMLKKETITLANGLPAYQAIFSWYPTPALKVYQQQIYVLADRTACRLTATFTEKTRQTLGPQIERLMLSFDPVKPGGPPAPSPGRRS